MRCDKAVRLFSVKAIARFFLSVSVVIEAALFRIFAHWGQSRRRERILVIRVDGIGDFILWLDAARALRELYPAPRFQVTLLATSSWAGLAERQKIFDEVWATDRGSYLGSAVYRWRLWGRIFSAGFGTVIHPTYSREFYVGDVLCRISGASTRIGWDGDLANEQGWQKKISDRWYTRLVRGKESHVMELQRNAEFVRALGLEDFRAQVPEIRFDRSKPAALESYDNYFVVFPGAAWTEKCWPSERWAEIAHRVRVRTGWVCVVCGANADKKHAAAFLEMKGCVDLVGKTSLMELVNVIGGSRLVLTNDTSAVHLAAVQRVPAVCVVGGGHFGRFLPYRAEGNARLPVVVHQEMDCFGCNWQCIFSMKRGRHYPCVENVSIEEVWDAVKGTCREEEQGTTSLA